VRLKGDERNILREVRRSLKVDDQEEQTCYSTRSSTAHLLVDEVQLS
jgi:hypothetical protein